MWLTAGRWTAGVVVVVSVAVDSPSVGRAEAASGVRQLAGQSGCLGGASAWHCRQVRPVRGDFNSWAFSPDQHTLYGVADHRSVVVLRRNAKTGRLSQLHGGAGCMNASGTGRCARARGMRWQEHWRGPIKVAISPDGRNVYVLAVQHFGRQLQHSAGTIVVFARDPRSGGLRQLTGSKGCVSSMAHDGCGVVRGLSDPTTLAIDPWGASVVTAGFDEIAVLGRNRRDGSLSPMRRAPRCFRRASRRGCERAPLDDDFSDDLHVTFAPDGRSVSFTYTGDTGQTIVPGRIVTLARTPATGALRALSGTAGCMTDEPDASCTGVGLSTRVQIPVFVDGDTTIVAASEPDGGRGETIMVMHRDQASGAFVHGGEPTSCWRGTWLVEEPDFPCQFLDLDPVLAGPVISGDRRTVFIAGGVAGDSPRRVLAFPISNSGAALGPPTAIDWAAGDGALMGAYPIALRPSRDGERLFLLSGPTVSALHVFKVTPDGRLSGREGPCFGRAPRCRAARGLDTIYAESAGWGEPEQLIESSDNRFLYVLSSRAAVFRLRP